MQAMTSHNSLKRASIGVGFLNDENTYWLNLHDKVKYAVGMDQFL